MSLHSNVCLDVENIRSYFLTASVFLMAQETRLSAKTGEGGLRREFIFQTRQKYMYWGE